MDIGTCTDMLDRNMHTHNIFKQSPKMQRSEKWQCSKLCLCPYKCTYICMFVCICTCTYVGVYVCMYMYIYVYVKATVPENFSKINNNNANTTNTQTSTHSRKSSYCVCMFEKGKIVLRDTIRYSYLKLKFKKHVFWINFQKDTYQI